jgi:3-oxoadipate enol-lactonase
MSSELIAIQAAELYVETAGTGEALVFVHAGVADARMWDAQWQTFAQHYRVIRYDLRGFGRSRALGGGTFSHADDLRQLCDSLGLERIRLVALSYGAAVALDFALLYPERVAALVLAAPAPDGEDPSPELLAFWKGEHAHLEAGDLDAATELNLRVWVDGVGRGPEAVASSVRAAVGEMQRALFELVPPEDLEELPSEEATPERLAKLTMPACVLVGAYDLADIQKRASFLATNIPSARLESFTQSAHMLNMEEPALFNQTVLGFLVQNEPKSA